MSLSGNGIIGIRREDKNKWERRCPITPTHVRALIEQGFRVLVQPSSRRIFADTAFESAGAQLSNDLSSCGTILAVKEVPIPLLLPNRTYMFFSHTIKGQPYNMPLLDAVQEKRIRLLDYETITKDGVRGGQRLVAFGRYAGLAGAIDFCRGLGERLLALGHSTPFLGVSSTYMYPDLAAAFQAVRDCGKRISENGLPDAVCPFTVAVAGRGKVANGSIEVLNQLPVKWVHPFELKDIASNAKGRDRTHVVYACVCGPEHVVKRRPGLDPVPDAAAPSASPGVGNVGRDATAAPQITAISSVTAHGPSTSGWSISASSVHTGVHANQAHARASEGISGSLTPAATTASPRMKMARAGSTGGFSAASSGTPRLPPSLPTTAEAPASGSAFHIGSGDAAADVIDELEAIPADVHVDEAAFDRFRFRSHPEEFDPVFHIKIAPYCSAIINCVYWEPKFPRLLSNEQVKTLQSEGRLRLVGVEDISCDYQGSIEFLREFTSIENPFVIYDPQQDAIHHSMDAAISADSPIGKSGIMYQAVDHLPSECPRDASEHFSECLLPLVPIIARSTEDANLPMEQQLRTLPSEIAGSIICAGGRLAPNFTYLAELRAAAAKAEAQRGLRKARNESFITLKLVGHLFDRKVVNKTLDAVEDRGGSAQIIDFRVGRDRSNQSEMRMQVFAPAAGLHGVGLARSASSVSTPAAATSPTTAQAVLSAMLEDIHSIAATSDVVVSVEGFGDGVAAASDPSSGATGGLQPASPAMLPAGSAPLSSMSASAHDGISGIHPTAASATAARQLGSILSGPSPHQPMERRALVLGAGFVSGPVVEYLLRRPANVVTVVSVVKGEAEALAAGRMRVHPLTMDVTSQDAVSSADGPVGSLISQHDIVISLIPATMHVPIAKLAIAHKRNMVTASYTSPEMAALHQQAAAAGITILNECGLDPGIDHMAAMKLIHEAQAAGGRVTSFISVCGGLPAPECANNPLGYKFSWSPRGALAAMRNAARYRREGEEVSIPPSGLLSAAEEYSLNPAFHLEVLPNRDSLPYGERYGIASDHLKTMFRGTLRYAGFASSMRLLVELGMLEQVPVAVPVDCSMRFLLSSALELSSASPSDDDLATAAASKIGVRSNDKSKLKKVKAFLEWCGFLGPSSSLKTAPLRGMHGTPPVAAGMATTASAEPMMCEHVPLDTTVAILTSMPSMSYAPGERDMALMQHVVDVEYPGSDGQQSVGDGRGGGVHHVGASAVAVAGRRERRTATMIEYARIHHEHRHSTSLSSSAPSTAAGHGDKHQPQTVTAMARTVGYTAAIAAQLILDGRITAAAKTKSAGAAPDAVVSSATDSSVSVPAVDDGVRGVVAPVAPCWYNPILQGLEGEGILMHETIEDLA